jgi:hypothetical protein
MQLDGCRRFPETSPPGFLKVPADLDLKLGEQRFAGRIRVDQAPVVIDAHDGMRVGAGEVLGPRIRAGAWRGAHGHSL